jgi:hypothetical protein
MYGGKGPYYSRWIEEITKGGTRFPSMNELMEKHPDLGNMNYWNAMWEFEKEGNGYNEQYNPYFPPKMLEYIITNGC